MLFCFGDDIDLIASDLRVVEEILQHLKKNTPRIDLISILTYTKYMVADRDRGRTSGNGTIYMFTLAYL